MGTLNVKGLGTFTVPDSFGSLPPEEQHRAVEEMVAHVKAGGGGSPPPTAAPETTSNPIMGALQTTEQTLGGAATLLSKGRSYVQSHVLGNPANDAATSYVRGVGDSLNQSAAGINYDPGTYQQAYADGGVPGVAKHFAGEAIANSPHLAAALNPVTLGIDLAGQTETNAEERAKNDGRQDPGLSDYAVGAGTAGIQEVAGRVGARSIVAPTAKSALARIAQSGLTGAATGAAGGEAQYLGTHAGTQTGTTPEGIVSSLVEGGGTGLAAGSIARSVGERIPADRTAANGLKGEAHIGKVGEEQAASNMRVAGLADQARKSAETAGTDGLSPQDSNAYKTVQGALIQKVAGTVDDLYHSAQITKEERRQLIGQRGSLINEAAVHNRMFGQDHLDVIDTLNVGDEVKQGLKDAFRDLNTATYNGMFKNGTGPLERVAGAVGKPVSYALTGALGWTYGHPEAALIAPTLAKGLKAAGRAGDTLLGNRSAPADASLTALKAAALNRQSLADAAQRDTLGALAGISQAARQRIALASQQQAQAKASAVTAKQKAKADREEARNRLMGSGNPDAEALGGFHADVLKSYNENGIPATRQDLLEAVDKINARGGFSSPAEYQAAKAGVRFPNYGDRLSPLFREMDAVLKAKGVSATQDSRAEAKADTAIVRAKTRAIVQEALPKAPRSPVEAPSVANTNSRPPRAPPVPKGARKAPSGSANGTSFEEGRRLHAYAATTHRAKVALEQAVRSAGDRTDLAELANHIANLDHKGAKAQAVDEAAKLHHGDAEATRFIMGPLRTLAGIGGRTAAEEKAVVKARAKTRKKSG